MNEREKNSLLKNIGLRVRNRRLEADLTIRELASRADLSLRFINQLEAGQGNISIAGLARVAQALSCSLNELLPPTNSDHSLRSQVWKKFSECSEADLQALQEWFAMRAKTLHSKFIALIGLRGAGKSTIGELLANKLNTEFIELDAHIEKAAGMKLGEIFSIHGENYYHRLEAEVLQKLFRNSKSCVLAAGGSIVNDTESWNLVKRFCFTVWLRATPREHMTRVLNQGDLRPMKDNPSAMTELKALLARRESVYAESELTISTSRKHPQQIADLIAQKINKHRTTQLKNPKAG
ncbi:MAG: shikimate kinase [Acidobacteriota bacterium]